MEKRAFLFCNGTTGSYLSSNVRFSGDIGKIAPCSSLQVTEKAFLPEIATHSSLSGEDTVQLQYESGSRAV